MSLTTKPYTHQVLRIVVSCTLCNNSVKLRLGGGIFRQKSGGSLSFEREGGIFFTVHAARLAATATPSAPQARKVLLKSLNVSGFKAMGVNGDEEVFFLMK